MEPWKVALQIGLALIEAAQKMAAAEGLSINQFAEERGRIEKERGGAIADALADLRKVLK